MVCDADTLWVRLEGTQLQSLAPRMLELGFVSLRRSANTLDARAHLSQRDDAESVRPRLEETAAQTGCEVASVQRLATLTCVGPALEDHPELLLRAQAVFAQHDIDVRNFTSEVTGYSFAIDIEQAEAATRALHDELIEPA